jgi:transcriptional regulator with XRE-family HTH domain
MTDTLLGQIIQDARLNAGLSVRELSYMCDITTVSIRKYENGRSRPSVETFSRIVLALNMEGEWVATDTWTHPSGSSFTLNHYLSPNTGRPRSHDYEAVREALLDFRLSIPDICSKLDITHNSLHYVAQTLRIHMGERAKIRNEVRILDEIAMEHRQRTKLVGEQIVKFREQNKSYSEPTTE